MKLYPMKESRLVFLGFFSGNSLIRCIEILGWSPREFRLGGPTLSEFLLPGGWSVLSSALPHSDFLKKGRFADSLSDLGLFTACTSSDTEFEAISFWRAATNPIIS